MKKVIEVNKGTQEGKLFTNKLKAYNWIETTIPKYFLKSYSKLIKDLRENGYCKMGDYQITERTIH